MQDRVKEEMRRENISAEKALYILHKDDEERRRWGMQLYGIDTWDSKLYDIVLHIQKLTVDDAVDILYQVARKPVYQATPESQRRVEDLALEARVKAKLAMIAPRVHVEADDGKVFIGNVEKASGSPGEAEIKSSALQVEGVTEVIFSLKASREQHDHINPFHNIG